MVTAAGEAASPDREHALRKAMLEFAAARVRKAFSHGSLAEASRVAPVSYLDRFRARQTLQAEESRTMTAMRDWLHHDDSDLRKLLSGTVLSRHSAKSFAELPEWDGALSGTHLLAELHSRLAARGMTLLVLDFSPPAHPDVHVVKVVVPALKSRQ